MYLTSFSPILPQIKMDQNDALSRTSELLGVDLKVVSRFGLKPSQISTRYFESTEIGPSDADIFQRGEFFSKRALEVFNQVYPESTPQPEHLIHVTCTGYVAPSPAQQLVALRGWNTEVTHAYHMGCYASLPSIRLAKGLIADHRKNVDIIHTEMCSLHFDRMNKTPEQIVVQTLFADGNIKYTVSKHAETPSLHLLKIAEQIIPDTLQDMTWTPGAKSMRMTLSRDIPTKISTNLKPFLEKLVEGSPVGLQTLLRKSLFAIHPGGPKIIDGIKESLELSDEQVAFSRSVLFERGNMSSSTLPHVWERILKNNVEPGTPVISLAFGPGLTIFGGLFEVTC